jgi:hypothetical protein
MLSDVSNIHQYQVKDACGMLASLRLNGAALNAGDTGTGKTYSIMAVGRQIGVAPVVICPKAVIPSWIRVAEFLGGKCYPINYESLTRGDNEFGKLWSPDGMPAMRAAVRKLAEEMDEYKRVEMILMGVTLLEGPSEHVLAYLRLTYSHGWYAAKSQQLTIAKDTLKQANAARKFTWAEGIPLIIFDEGHRCCAQKSLNSKALYAAKRQGIPVIVASATAARDPLQMYALGYALGLHKGVNFWQWARRYGCEPGEHGGLIFRGGQPALIRLHQEIFPTRGVRITREQIPDFPETQITAELYELPEQDQLDALYKDVEEQLKILDGKMSRDRDLEHPLTLLLRARQRIELLKVPLFVELAQDAMAEGMNVAIFVNFDETLREICERLETSCKIDGSQTGAAGTAERQRCIDAFNSGESQDIVCNIRAGGVGVSLHDTDGRFPRLALISPTYSAIDLVQVFGRVWRSGAKGAKSLQRVVLVKGSVEEGIHKKLQISLKNLSLINDGDLRPYFS